MIGKSSKRQNMNNSGKKVNFDIDFEVEDADVKEVDNTFDDEYGYEDMLEECASFHLVDEREGQGFDMRNLLSQCSDQSDVLSQHSDAVSTFLDQSSESLSQQLKRSCHHPKTWKPAKLAKTKRFQILNLNSYRLKELFGREKDEMDENEENED